LKLALQAPSGYNLQPWRFIVVQDEPNRRKLQKAAWRQARISEAPVVVIAVGLEENWERRASDVLREGVQRGAGKIEGLEQQKQQAVDFLANIPIEAWLNRQVMIALTAMMLLAEAYGFDTAAMEGFDPDK
jgi:nitroreductase